MQYVRFIYFFYLITPFQASVLIRMCSLNMFFKMILSLRLIWTQATGEGDFIVDSTDMSLEIYLRDSLVLTLTAGKPEPFMFNPNVISELSFPGSFIITLCTMKSDTFMLNSGVDLHICLAPS